MPGRGSTIRAELHAYAVVHDYVSLLSGIGDVDEILDRNPHDLVMWGADSDVARHLLDDPAYEVHPPRPPGRGGLPPRVLLLLTDISGRFVP